MPVTIDKILGEPLLHSHTGSDITDLTTLLAAKVDKAGDTMTGDLIFSGSQKIIGGTGTTADLTFQTTSGVGATGADMHFLVGNNGATEAMTILNNGRVGFGTNDPLCTVHIIGPNNATGGLRMQDNLTNNSTKVARFKVGHYTNAEEPVTAMLIFSSAVSNEINYGGGSGSENAATTLNFYTGANPTTTTGTIRMSINSFGNAGIGTIGPLARLHVFGTVDDEQFIVQGHSTQTAPLMQLWNSSSAILVSFSGLGGAIFNEQGNDADFRVEGDTDANLLFVDASADSVQIGSATTADSAKFYVSGKISTSGEMEINGALNHDGTTVGLYGVTPVARASAYTQTYSTAARTVNPASTASFIGIDNLQVGSVYATVADLNQLRTDLLQAMQLINSLVDDSQAIGISQ